MEFLLIVFILLIGRELSLYYEVLDPPLLHSEYELFDSEDQLLEVLLVLQPVPVILKLEEGVLDADTDPPPLLADLLHILLGDAALGDVVNCVLVGCLGDEVAEEPHDQALVGDLKPLAHIGPIFLELVKDNLPILSLVIHPCVNVLGVPHRGGIEDKVCKVLLGKHGLEPLDLVFSEALLMNEGFEFGGHSEVITLDQPFILVIR